jgi:hypothetical protein
MEHSGVDREGGESSFDHHKFDHHKFDALDVLALSSSK